METQETFDVMYEVEAPVANVWEARLMAQGHLAQDLNHGPDYAIEDWDAETDSVQFRVTLYGDYDEDVNWFYGAVGSRKAA